MHMTIVIPNCLTVKEVQQTTAKDGHLQELRVHVIRS